MNYVGRKTSQISFPLGGIGTGCIGLGGNGRFLDIEIGNEPNKDSCGDFMHFAVKAEDENEVIDARVLNGDMQPPYMGHSARPRYSGFGFGPDRGSMAGMPHFIDCAFEGEFPFATLTFSDPHFPGTVKMTAFNPFIPTNSFDSSLPAAFFSVELNNTSDRSLQYTLAFTAKNFFTDTKAIHRLLPKDDITMLHLSSCEDKNSTDYGDLTIATDAPEISAQEYWFRGNWFDGLSTFWRDFNTPGKLKNRHYDEERNNVNVMACDDFATLAAHIHLQAGARQTIRFVFTWSKPWRTNTWELSNPALTEAQIKEIRNTPWKNYYATQFETSKETAAYALREFSRLESETRLFKEALFSSSMPPEVIDAISANLSVLKSPTCMRLTDGSFYAFEGVHRQEGSCEGTCTHVWSYAYALAYLFPDLERSARALEYRYSMQPHGGMGFRLQLPIGTGPTQFRPCVDGQFGCVIRVYREFMLSGDIAWLQDIWPQVKKSISFAWSPENPDKWDLNRDGLMEGRQHHTLDMELFGENAWLSGMYLTGLQAAIRLAHILGEPDTAAEYAAIYESGRQKLNKLLFNNDYFIQKLDLSDQSILSFYDGANSLQGETAIKAYWNEETQEVKYQIGEGCSIDQVLGQWHADLLQLGRTFDKDKTKAALQAIYRNNFIPVLREHANPCRIYGLNDESGTIICSYPAGVKRPSIPLPYAEETMHGFEYEVASHMLFYGMEEEGLRCVRAVRDRYDGERRNPWNEMECGSNYARSLSSYALLLAYSGFVCDLPHLKLSFAPLDDRNGTWFFSMDSGFGTITYKDDHAAFTLLYGELLVKTLELGRPCSGKACLDNYPLASRFMGTFIELAQPLTMKAGQVLYIPFIHHI